MFPHLSPLEHRDAVEFGRSPTRRVVPVPHRFGVGRWYARLRQQHHPRTPQPIAEATDGAAQRDRPRVADPCAEDDQRGDHVGTSHSFRHSHYRLFGKRFCLNAADQSRLSCYILRLITELVILNPIKRA